MLWLDLNADEGPYYQTQRYPRYREVLAQMRAAGNAYDCYCTKAELEELRARQIAAKQKPRFEGN